MTNAAIHNINGKKYTTSAEKGALTDPSFLTAELGKRLAEATGKKESEITL